MSIWLSFKDRSARRQAATTMTFRPEFQPPWTGEPQVTMVALDRLWGPDCAPTLICATKLCVVRQTATSR
jgi:hypothetical protein